MKKFLLVLPVLVLLAVQGASAQRNNPFGIGPYLMLKGGVNAASIPNGYKTGFAISGLPDIGVSTYIPLGKSNALALIGDIGYSTYAYGERIVVGDIEGDLYKWQYSYLTISPSIYLSSFLLGFDLGIPLSASVVSDDESVDVDTDLFATMLEIHAGGMIPVMETKQGRLNVLIRAGYMLTGIRADSNSDFNPKAATFGLGLNYHFSLR